MRDLVLGPRVWKTQDVEKYAVWKTWSLVENIGSSGKHRVSVENMAEHSFQEPKPNSLLLLSHLCFGACFWQESTLTTEDFILAFRLMCVLLPWQWG